jgi:hypothetical protein
MRLTRFVDVGWERSSAKRTQPEIAWFLTFVPTVGCKQVVDASLGEKTYRALRMAGARHQWRGVTWLGVPLRAVLE